MFQNVGGPRAFTSRRHFREQLFIDAVSGRGLECDSWFSAGGEMLAGVGLLREYSGLDSLIDSVESGMYFGLLERDEMGQGPELADYVTAAEQALGQYGGIDGTELERAAAFAVLAHAQSYVEDGEAEAMRLARAAVDWFAAYAGNPNPFVGVPPVDLLERLLYEAELGSELPDGLKRRLFILRLFGEGVARVHPPVLPWAFELLEATFYQNVSELEWAARASSAAIGALEAELRHAAIPNRTQVAVAQLRLAALAAVNGDVAQVKHYRELAAATIRDYDLLRLSERRTKIKEVQDEVENLLT